MPRQVAVMRLVPFLQQRFKFGWRHLNYRHAERLAVLHVAGPHVGRPGPHFRVDPIHVFLHKLLLLPIYFGRAEPGGLEMLSLVKDSFQQGQPVVVRAAVECMHTFAKNIVTKRCTLRAAAPENNDVSFDVCQPCPITATSP